MAKRFPVAPAHPERICWGCDAYCPARDMRCGNGSERAQHPIELFGADWLELEPPGSPFVRSARDATEALAGPRDA